MIDHLARYAVGATGIYQIPDAAYRASEAVSKHDLDVVAKSSPGHLIKARADKLNGTSPEHSAATLATFAVGTALHLLVLEPERAQQLIIVNSGARTTTAGKLAYKLAQDEAQERGPEAVILTSAQYEEVSAWAAALRDDARLAAWLADPSCQTEASMQWRDGATGTLCRGRADAILTPASRASSARPALILDVKTAVDASPQGFGRAAANYLYHAQGAYYCDGYEAITGWAASFVLIVVEKSTRAVATYYLDADDMAAGRARYRAPLDAWAEHQARLVAGEEPPTFYDTRPQRLMLPAWEHKQARYGHGGSR